MLLLLALAFLLVPRPSTVFARRFFSFRFFFLLRRKFM